jgi:hypothetical protein
LNGTAFQEPAQVGCERARRFVSPVRVTMKRLANNVLEIPAQFVAEDGWGNDVLIYYRPHPVRGSFIANRMRR